MARRLFFCEQSRVLCFTSKLRLSLLFLLLFGFAGLCALCPFIYVSPFLGRYAYASIENGRRDMSPKRLYAPLPRLLQRVCLPRSQPSLRVHSLSSCFLPWVPLSYLPGYCQYLRSNGQQLEGDRLSSESRLFGGVCFLVTCQSNLISYRYRILPPSL